MSVITSAISIIKSISGNVRVGAGIPSERNAKGGVGGSESQEKKRGANAGNPIDIVNMDFVVDLANDSSRHASLRQSC